MKQFTRRREKNSEDYSTKRKESGGGDGIMPIGIIPPGAKAEWHVSPKAKAMDAKRTWYNADSGQGLMPIAEWLNRISTILGGKNVRKRSS